MIDTKDIPYGALYSFQPDYLGYLIHDKIVHEDEELEVPTIIEIAIEPNDDHLYPDPHRNLDQFLNCVILRRKPCLKSLKPRIPPRRRLLRAELLLRNSRLKRQRYLSRI